MVPFSFILIFITWKYPDAIIAIPSPVGIVLTGMYVMTIVLVAAIVYTKNEK